MIPLSNIYQAGKEREYVNTALDSNWVSGSDGEFTHRFEAEVADHILRKHVIATANGTLALEAALRAIGIGPGDIVNVPALTFAAPAAAVANVGAIPRFVDIDPISWTIDPELIDLSWAKATIAVDLLGHPAQFSDFRLGQRTIEDAAQAHGARAFDRPTGSFGLLSTFSFHANKAISTGEGGCIATDDVDLAARIRLLVNHGMKKERPYYHEIVGMNARMSNLAAAFGLAQVEEWNWLIAQRQAVNALYVKYLTMLTPRPHADWASPSVCLAAFSHPQRDAVVAGLRHRGVDARAIWPPLVDLLPYQQYKTHNNYPVARQVAASTFVLPTYAGMAVETLHTVIEAVKETCAELEGEKIP